MTCAEAMAPTLLDPHVAVAARLGRELRVEPCGGDDDDDSSAPTPDVEETPEFAAGTTMASLADAGSIRIGTKFDQPGLGNIHLETGDPEGFDVELDELEADFLRAPSDEPLQRLFSMKRRLATLRRAIAPERDVFAHLDRDGIPGLDTESARYFRDVSDHLYRLAETIDNFHELTLAAMDVFLSSSSNRMNQVMKQLTIIATIFLPLSYIAGFWGQNFRFMVDHVGSAAAFLLGAVVLQLATGIFLVVYFRRKHWL